MLPTFYRPPPPACKHKHHTSEYSSMLPLTVADIFMAPSLSVHAPAFTSGASHNKSSRERYTYQLWDIPLPPTLQVTKRNT
ncbi:hypothetical protein GDO81_004254 [Engystomops pustulosus]|uniref:Uncharacterized protein n=1 Tax=Engystomops pustulosus TaxID=76066 RepID=A0AAV6ZYP3_ENGPU|nr:hypothetical protein GDO81_004254 [Engystomops pustulosus]